MSRNCGIGGPQSAPHSIALCAEALTATAGYVAAARRAVLRRVRKDGAIDAGLIEREQFAVHGYAWYATYHYALQALLDWARRLESAGKLDEIESLTLLAAYGEY